MYIKNEATIPDGLVFSDLKLARDTDGYVSFDWSPVEAICKANGLDVDVFREGPEENVAALILAWYLAQRQRGGALDLVQEDIIEENMLEDGHDGGISYISGRA